MSELKKYTRLGSNSRQLAALLQARAPKGHMLAYINPQEAALLKAHGGSGREHEDTGIPSYELDDSFALQGDTGGLPELTDTAPPTADTYGGDAYSAPPMEFGGGLSAAPSSTGFNLAGPTGGLGLQGKSFEGIQAAPDALETPALTSVPRPEYALGGTAALGTGAIDEARAPEKSLFGGMGKDTLARLGLAGALVYLGSRQAKKAGEQGQAGKAEMQQLATPYQRAGAEMQQKAQRGELMPVGQQAMQAAQAQAAQDIQRRGGVGAQQAQQQMTNLRQQLLQQQYDYGLKLSGIGDNIALGAIRTGLQADQYVNQLTNDFYTRMAYVASGMVPGTRTGGQ